MKSRFLASAFLFLCVGKEILAQQNTACTGVIAGNFVRNSASCQSYYYCDGRNAFAGDCPPNFHFNARMQVCDQPRSVDCTECSPWGVQHIQDPTTCSGHFRCSNGQRTSVTCSANLMFDLDTGECRAHGNGGRCIPPAPPAPPTGSPIQIPINPTHAPITSICSGHNAVTVGDASDCTQFFYCLNGRSFRQLCAPSLFYNAWNGRCQLPGTWNYCQGPGQLILPNENFIEPLPPAPSTTTTKAPATTTTKAATTTTKAGATTMKAATTTTKAGATTTKATTTRATTTKARAQEYDFDCSHEENYTTHPHPFTCEQFFRCYNGIASIMDCVTNYYWDIEKAMCTSTKPAGC